VQTLSPALKLFTLGPTASVIPAPSEQGTTPGVKNGGGGYPGFVSIVHWNFITGGMNKKAMCARL
jgi:hypothetical protein